MFSGGNDPNDTFNMTRAEVENLRKVLHYTRVRNTAEFECSKHFKNEVGFTIDDIHLGED